MDEMLGEESFSMETALKNMISGETVFSKEAVQQFLRSLFFERLEKERANFFRILLLVLAAAVFSNFAEVISTSMRQLLPYEGHMCGIAKIGYYPEVVQHTSWDYGKNGKGYYNDIFAPGWTVASLWELFTPGRAEIFMGK